ncbi:MAG: CDP-diacylglycerol--serine O-phosphatidyltransferase [Proteobacteria bacterium]|nr:CDP-diacylglycerol--serine O-phosphatidyltransferase [Pseudomonadota bacterium]
MRRRKKKTGKGERRGIYILPNLFTSASLFGGFYAIIAAIQGRYEAAAMAIIISSVLDGIDGRVARFTRTTSHFGVEYDSLSDLIAFGVAPGVLAFQWALEPFGRLGWLAAFMYVICGALRLARFNVQKIIEDPHFFKGLPIPAAACFIASLILFAHALGGIPENRSVIIIIMIYFLSFLMVSTIKFYSFKGFDIRNRRPFHVLVSIILICLVIAYKPTIMIFLIMFTYVLSGPTMGLYRLYRRRSLKKRADEEMSESMRHKGQGKTLDQETVEEAETN